MCDRGHLACPQEAISKRCGLSQCPGHWTHISKSLCRKGSHLHCLSKQKTLHHRVPSLTQCCSHTPVTVTAVFKQRGPDHRKGQHFPVVQGADSHPPQREPPCAHCVHGPPSNHFVCSCSNCRSTETVWQ